VSGKVGKIDAVVPPLNVSEFEAVPKKATGGTCSFQRLPLSETDRKVLDEILFQRGHDITAKAIVKVLADHKVPVSSQSVARHRRGDCLCKRP
jgi:hypothetical protein